MEIFEKEKCSRHCRHSKEGEVTIFFVGFAKGEVAAEDAKYNRLQKCLFIAKMYHRRGKDLPKKAYPSHRKATKIHRKRH